MTLPLESRVTPGISLLPRVRGPIPERKSKLPTRFACGNAPTGSGARELSNVSSISFSHRFLITSTNTVRAAQSQILRQLINVEVMPCGNAPFVILLHFFQQLLLASGFSALVRARLIASRVSAMVKD